MGALPFFVVPYLYVAPISWAGWPGPVKGAEVSLLDGFSLAVLLSTPSTRIPVSIKLSFGIIAVALIISTCAGYQVIPAGFYAWQCVRAVLLFVAVARICASDRRALVALISGGGVGLGFEAIMALHQYLLGDPRPGGNLGHANFLGLASDFVVYPTLALLLGGRRLIGPGIVLLAGLLIAVIGGSRATLGLFAAGSLLTVLLSLIHRRTSRKIGFAAAFALLLVVSVPVLSWSTHRRTQADLNSSDLERSAMKLAASMMISDHPLGVGANQYVIVANTGGYSARAGVPWNADDRAAPVHDAYYLVAAELGIPGLIGLIALLASFISVGFRCLGRLNGDQNSELLPGLLAAMIVVSVHIAFEWVFMHFVLHYLLALCAGMLVAVAAYARKPKAESAAVYRAKSNLSHAS